MVALVRYEPSDIMPLIDTSLVPVIHTYISTTTHTFVVIYSLALLHNYGHVTLIMVICTV